LPRLFALLLVLSLCLSSALPAKDVWTGVARIVAIGDVHGDYDQLFTLLTQTGLVDGKGRWAGGKTHLVQTGDIPDRGPDTRKIIDLMMRLEKQAKKAGGFVHPLIGNHDAMNVYGDVRYVTPGEFASFRDNESERVRDAFYEEHLKQLEQMKDAGQEAPEADDSYKTGWFAKHPLGFFEHRVAFGPNGKYGKWIMSHNAVIKINDILFVHAGISSRVAAIGIGEINKTVRKELKDTSLLQGGLSVASDGPLWYRGLAQGNEEELAPGLDAALESYGVERIVIGHTPTMGTVIPRFGGKVVMIDVGLAQHYGGRLACLVIENGEAYTLHRGERLDLPDGSKDGLLDYLKQAAGLDPAPSPLLPLIQQLEVSPRTAE